MQMGWYSGDRTPEGFAEQARKVVEKGYTALKFDLFGNAYMGLSRYETSEVKDLVSAVREAVGKNVYIMIEGHDRFSVRSAIEIGHWLKDYEVTWFETSTMSNDVNALVEVGKSVPVRIIAGERMHYLHEFANFLSSNIKDIINPEPTAIGGIWKSIQVASIADHIMHKYPFITPKVL